MVELAPRLDDSYRIEVFADQDEVDEAAILDLWAEQGAVPAGEAERRLQEVLLVGIHSTSGLVGVSSAYLQESPQLRMELWYYRAFVAQAHRMSNVAVLLALIGRDHLEELYTSGRDTRGAGLLYEVENEGLKRQFNEALWFPTLVTFVGENKRGDHVRVRYFPGAVAPEPPTSKA